MTRLAWITDPHLNMIGFDKAKKLGRWVRSMGDACLITGDIAEGDSVCRYLETFLDGFQGDVYFVLGNHDIWKSSFEQVDSDIRILCKESPDLHWLSDGKVHLVGGTQICGVDGWYDYQAGITTERVNFIMNDWHQIEEMKANFAVYQMGFPNPLIEQLRTIGQESAIEARRTLNTCKKDKPVLFATHVPPFAEASWHEGKQSSATHLPFYTNIALGYVLKDWASENRSTPITTLCGHTHSPGTYQAAINLIVHSGRSQYGQPTVTKSFDL